MIDTYSAIGLTNAIDMPFILQLLSTTFKFLYKNPRTEYALLAILEVCLFQLRFARNGNTKMLTRVITLVIGQVID